MKSRFYRSYNDVPANEWPWKNFKPKEIACKGSGEVLAVEEALDALQLLREKWGKPMAVRSGYRSPEHNRAVGGVKQSKHMDGTAFDIATTQEEQAAFVRMARECGFKGIGLYDDFTHIDLGPLRSWDERKK